MKRIWGLAKSYIVFLTVLIALAIASLYVSKTVMFYLVLAALVVAVFVISGEIFTTGGRIKAIIGDVAKQLTTIESQALLELKLPVMISSGGEIVWCNSSLEKLLPAINQIIGKKITDVMDEKSYNDLLAKGISEFSLENKIFAVFCSSVVRDSVDFTVYYMLDITKEKQMELQYEQSRPVVAIVAMDNLDEISSTAKDSEIGAFKSAIQTEIEKWVSNTGGISRRLTSDRYLMLFEERSYKRLSEEHFEILERVRKIKLGESNATLSIGVGRGGDTLAECEELAKQALDMALGRGGDQAAIKMPNNEFKFFGGASGSVQKRTRVRARIIAASIKQLISSSDRVVLMGHAYSDLDSLGACYGILNTVKCLGKEAHIVLDRKSTMALPLLERIESIDETFSLTDPKKLIPYITKSTLLIIVDTHRPTFIENKEIYDACDNIVVIDHHRRAVDYINNAVIFYNEPAASSVCEMVTEIIQYINPRSAGQLQAEALLSGIMLDTRNFSLHTGVRTFEASAFLRERGADPTLVKKLFSGSMPAYKQKADIVAAAEIYDKYAITQSSVCDEYTRVASAQAADELLGISDVSASFVMCKIETGINISARSLGSVNVQVIMEILGGGGHRTMAATQLDTEDFSKAKELLLKAINEYECNSSVSSNQKGTT